LLSIGRICGRGLPPLCTLAHGSCRVGLRSALGMRANRQSVLWDWSLF